MSQTNVTREVVRIAITVMTGIVVALWSGGLGAHLLRGDPKAWYDFPLLMTIIYSAVGLGVLAGVRVWKLSDRLK